MTINDRILSLRKKRQLSQKEFGEKIGLKYGAIGKMERPGGTVTEQNIQMICSEFHVNREWLVDGVGEMDSKPTYLLDLLSERYNLGDKGRSLIEAFLKLSAEQQDLIVESVCFAADEVRALEQTANISRQPQLQKAAHDAEAHARLQQELDEEDGKKLSASQDGSSDMNGTED